MGLESTTNIAGLDPTWPTVGDPRSQGDDHLRLLKNVLKNTFPGAGGLGFNIPITVSEADLNKVTGLVLPKPVFIVGKSTNQVVTVGATVTVSFDTEIVDNNNGFASNQYVVPTNCNGTWLLGATFSPINGQSNWSGSLQINGTDYAVTGSVGANSTTGGMTISTMALLAVGDVVRLRATLIATATSLSSFSKFWGVKIDS